MDNITRTPEVNRVLRGHAFYPPKPLRRRIPGLYATEGTSCGEKTIYVRYFASWGEWLIAELDCACGYFTAQAARARPSGARPKPRATRSTNPPPLP